MSVTGIPAVMPPARTYAARGVEQEPGKKPDRVALADASKRGVNTGQAKAMGVAYRDTAAAADARARELREEELIEERRLADRDAAREVLNDRAQRRIDAQA